jgi:arylsulfatase A-like enzyme
MTTPPPFAGVIGRTYQESTPDFAVAPHPGADAPNVLVILIDDLGFGHFGCFGSPIATPHIDRLAADGLRYTNFHVTPLCSPTRAALLTGRNHHTVGMRGLSNFNTGFPHMRGKVSPNAATMGEVLREAGYATFAVGKWHLCQMEDASAAGPYDQWPLGRGFDRFYGFMDGETDQYHPDLTYDNHRIEPPRTAAEGYHLTEDLIDKAIAFIHDTKSLRPDRPFFTYLALGATHAPHQAPRPYLEKYRGAFDRGWDEVRAEVYARQQAMGLLPAGTALAPRNPGVEAWAELSDVQRQLAARLQEAFAGFLEHTDAQLGRLFDDLATIGELDNTIVFLMSDNGASQEGGPFGVMHEMKFFNGILEMPEEAVQRLDDIGGPHSHTNYPWGWAQAGNTPFKWYKQNTHEGGVHVPLVVRYPRAIAERGGLRDQFTHVTDIAATVYELAGVRVPDVYRGFEQLPLAGVSMAPTFTDATAPAPKQVQYFEMVGHRAIYADGWKAVTRHTQNVPYDDDPWELYHYEVDRSECTDLAATHPEKLREMIALWWREAEQHGVLPLDDRLIELFGTRFQEHGIHRPDRRYVYLPPVSPMPMQASASVGGRSFDLHAHVTADATTNGVLYALGTENSGMAVFVKNARLCFDYNAFNDHTLVVADRDLPHGAVTLSVAFRRGPKGTAAVALLYDGEVVAQATIPFMMRVISSVGSRVGADSHSPVSLEYQGPFPFSSPFTKLEIVLLAKGEDGALRDAEVREGMARQ